MIATSIVTMFVLKYSNVYEMGHIWFSQTRMWMALGLHGRLRTIPATNTVRMPSAPRSATQASPSRASANVVAVSDFFSAKLCSWV
tara:strand:- start:2389 stop:2646 length:258 start_codon:yes stop_codon:yes gene_type:complete